MISKIWLRKDKKLYVLELSNFDVSKLRLYLIRVVIHKSVDAMPLEYCARVVYRFRRIQRFYVVDVTCHAPSFPLGLLRRPAASFFLRPPRPVRPLILASDNASHTFSLALCLKISFLLFRYWQPFFVREKPRQTMSRGDLVFGTRFS